MKQELMKKIESMGYDNPREFVKDNLKLLSPMESKLAIALFEIEGENGNQS